MKNLLTVIASMLLVQGLMAAATPARSELIPLQTANAATILAGDAPSLTEPVPAAVTNAFAKQFPDAILKKWESGKEGYIARFKRGGKKLFAYFSPDGQWRGTESTVKWTRHLPDHVQTGWEESGYQDWNVYNIRKIETPQRPIYVLHVNNGALLSSDKYDAFREDHVLYFTPEGELIKKERI